MRILIDECVDWRLIRDLADYDAKTVRQLGWLEIENGALLTLAASEFDVFITVDSNLPHQQNAAGLGLAVVVLRGRSTRLPDLRALLPALREAIGTAKPGEIRVVSWRDSQ